MTPRAMRISLQIWAYCDPRGWDCTVKEIGEEIGESWQMVVSVCHRKGWTRRLRVETPSGTRSEAYYYTQLTDDCLEGHWL